MSTEIVVNNNIIVDIKKAVIGAFKKAFRDLSYPDAEIKDISISQDYPVEENSYPHLWVNFSFTKLQQAGIGHSFLDGDTIRHEFQFEGKVTVNIHALSSKSRDVLSSQLIQMLAFRELNPVAAQFDEFLTTKQGVYISINRDTLEILGQSTTVGTPWSADELSYEDGYAFDVVGQIESTYRTTMEVLKKIVITADSNLPGDPGLEVEITENSIPAGEWI